MQNQAESNAMVLALSAEHYALLANLAEEKKAAIPEIASAGLIEWLEQELSLAHGRNIMRQLSKGLRHIDPDVSTPGPTGVARNHDQYLCARSA